LYVQSFEITPNKIALITLHLRIIT